jgi:NADPH:quinone reductase-like Zn-dependent oxidoreductase
VPAHLSLDQAAALPMALGTAYNSLFVAGRLRAGETVLVHGVGGGVAQIGLQLAVAAGAAVIVTSSDDAKLEKARELGACHTVNYRRDDVVASVREVVGADGVDLVLDGVGGPALLASLEVVATEGYGRVVRFGTASRNLVDVPSSLLSLRNVVTGGMASPAEMADAVAFVAGHRVTPAVDKPAPLEEWAAAVELLERAGQNGKLVLEIG